MKLENILEYVLGKVKIFAVDKSNMLDVFAFPLEDYDLDDDTEYDNCLEKYGSKNIEHLRAHHDETWIVIYN